MSFLPSEAGAVATGLTQPMINQINAPPPPMPQRQQLAQQMASPTMRNMYNQLSGQELLMMKLGRMPENFNAQQARNDQLMRIFAGSMGPGAAGAGAGSGRSGGHRGGYR
jgi:hypothetical protein